MSIKKLILLCLTPIVLSSCGSETDDENKAKQDLNKIAPVQTISISKDVINEMIRTLPQPIEIANIITSSKIGFSKEVLLPSDAKNKFEDNYTLAMGFGAYGVDLGYINLNNKILYSVEYLDCLSNVAEKLKVGQFFDYKTLSEMSKNKSNADSLIHLSTKNFNKIDDFLKEQNRGEQSILILIGAWIEGMHVFSSINSKEPKVEIERKVGEQKVIYENINLILGKLQEVDFFKNLKTDFDGLKVDYDAVKITTEFMPPETKEVNGELVIVDMSKTVVDYKKETITSLMNKLETIRNKYLIK